jgi:hypothetical protein
MLAIFVEQRAEERFASAAAVRAFYSDDRG